jgi:hypothetical protein
LPASKSKKGRKYGRKRAGDSKCGPAKNRYDNEGRRFRNKLRRVIRCNGAAAADAYRQKYGSKVHAGKKLKRERQS